MRGRVAQRGFPAWLPVVVVFALISWLIALPLGFADQAHLPTCACGDVAQEAWWLSLVQSSLAHGHLPLTTTRIDLPRGISIFDNAGFPLLAVLMAPVTALLGPVASLVLLLRASFFVTAVVTFVVLRRVTSTVLGAAVGGALYAFSPYMTHQAASHFFLVFGPLPPILLYLLHREMTGAGDGHLRSAGLSIGALVVLQYLIDSEVLAMVVVAAGVTLFLLAVTRMVRGRSLLRPGRRLAALGAWSLVVAVPLLAYPVWRTLTGSQRLVGATQPLSAGGVDIRATFFPADRGVLAGVWRAWRIVPQTFLGHSSFIGVPLVLVCAAVALTNRRRTLVRVAVLFGAVAWVLQLGPHLQVGTHTTAIPLPFDAIQPAPVLQDIISSRFAQFVDLSVAVLVAVGVDQLGARYRRGRVAGLLPATAGMLAAIALVAPISAYGAVDIGAARAFRGSPSSGPVRAGAALAYPYPEFPDDQAMLWQAESGMRFSLLGGYAIRPGAGRRSTRLPLVTAPAAVADTWLQAHRDPRSVTVGSAPWEAARRALPLLVRDRDLSMILVQTGVPGAAAIVDLVSSRYGPPDDLAGVDIWDLPSRPRIRSPPVR